jgi:hypothetical protein
MVIALLALVCSGCNQKTGWTKESLAAAQQARASLTNFTAALQSSEYTLRLYQVHAYFPSVTAPDGEFAWVNVWKYDGTSFTGAVVEAHPRLGLTNNQPVIVPETNIVDWAYLSKTGLVGRFLDRARR